MPPNPIRVLADHELTDGDDTSWEARHYDDSGLLFGAAAAALAWGVGLWGLHAITSWPGRVTGFVIWLAGLVGVFGWALWRSATTSSALDKIATFLITDDWSAPRPTMAAGIEIDQYRPLTRAEILECGMWARRSSSKTVRTTWAKWLRATKQSDLLRIRVCDQVVLMNAVRAADPVALDSAPGKTVRADTIVLAPVDIDQESAHERERESPFRSVNIPMFMRLSDE